VVQLLFVTAAVEQELKDYQLERQPQDAKV
jgi:hypothetical protein